MKNQQMILFREVLECTDTFPPEERYEFLRGVIEYGLDGTPLLKEKYAAAFILCKSIIDIQQRRYAEKINRFKEKRKEKEPQKKKKTLPFSDKEEDIIRQVMNYWNVQGLQKIERVTTQRKENVRRLIVAGEETYMLLNTIKKLKNCKFLCGDNSRNWKANFDWLFSKTENYYKVKKGFYDDKNKNKTDNKKVNNIW